MILYFKIWANHFYKKMEIGESFFGRTHGKLAHLRILAPKIFHGLGFYIVSQQ